MKRIFTILISLVLLFSLVACNSEKTGEAASSDNTSTIHAHIFAPATCDTPQTCECGETLGDRLGHMYIDGSCTVCSAVTNEKPKIGNLMVLGDSISTFEGYTYYEDHHWYMDGGRDDNTTDVTNVRQTYWNILLSNTKGKLVALQASSGSTICNTVGNGHYVKPNSFISRFENMIKDGFFEKTKVDTLIIYGGTNDSNRGSPIGELKYSDWTEEDLDNFAPAVCYLFDKIKKTLPDTRVIVIVDSTLRYVVTDALFAASAHYGFETVEIGSEIDMIRPHPTILGMKQIEREIRKVIFPEIY